MLVGLLVGGKHIVLLQRWLARVLARDAYGTLMTDYFSGTRHALHTHSFAQPGQL